jgi:hypothetical protein
MEQAGVNNAFNFTGSNVNKVNGGGAMDSAKIRERKQQYIPNNNWCSDPLIKREQFGISLRKKKKEAIIKNKRMKIMQVLRQEQQDRSQDNSSAEDGSMKSDNSSVLSDDETKTLQDMKMEFCNQEADWVT